MLRICLLLVLSFGSVQSAVGSDLVGRVRFIDGDTLDVGRERVRLFGIDAPEKDQHCKTDAGRVWTCGAWASRHARKLYDRKTARCERIDIDRYGRTVARCFVGAQDIGETLVRDGAAKAFRRYSSDYVGAEKQAAISDRGLWGGSMQDPADFRAAKKTQTTATPAPGNCNIKGNISNNGRIYHMPGQKYYNNTSIRTTKGERWFCTQSEARAAGWRKARQ